MRRWLIVALVVVDALLPGTAHSEEMELVVKPVLCIVDRRNPTCEMAYLVVWRSESSGYYCLFNNLVSAPLRCWNDEQDGQLTEERSITTGFSYWMAGRDPQERLAQVDVEVLRMDSDDRRRRRRTRHVWDIN